MFKRYMIVLAILCVGIYVLAYSSFNYSRRNSDAADALSEQCKSLDGMDWAERCDTNSSSSELSRLYANASLGSEASSVQANYSFYVLLLMGVSLIGRWIYRAGSPGKTNEVRVSDAVRRGDPDLSGNYDSGQGVPQDPTEAARWFQKAAAQGQSRAQFSLGVMYEKGHGVLQDYTEAVNWYRKAAHQGYPDAQSNLGAMYEDGTGIPQDYTMAAELYRRAAIQGLPAAQASLGSLYLRGMGVPQDDAEGVKWTQAAENGHAEASQPRLHLREGRGVLKDDAEAMKWYRMSAERATRRPSPV